MTTVFIEADDLRMIANGDHAVAQDLSFSLSSKDKQRVLIFSGPSGCGKSLLLKTISGEFQNKIGKLHVSSVPRKRIRIPQHWNARIAMNLSVLEILEGVCSEAVWPLIAHMELVELHCLNKRWNDLSHSEQKKTLLCRALLQKPELLLIDEAYANLDRESRNQLSHVLKDYIQDTGILVLASSEMPLELEELQPYKHVFLDRRGLPRKNQSHKTTKKSAKRERP